MKTRYCLSCYAPNAYVFSAPLRASTTWLKKTLRRNDLIDGTPLQRHQVEVLSRKLIDYVEVGWHPELEYVLESFSVGGSPKKSSAKRRSA